MSGFSNLSKIHKAERKRSFDYNMPGILVINENSAEVTRIQEHDSNTRHIEPEIVQFDMK
jgi:hypothetical protein